MSIICLLLGDPSVDVSIPQMVLDGTFDVYIPIEDAPSEVFVSLYYNVVIMIPQLPDKAPMVRLDVR